MGFGNITIDGDSLNVVNILKLSIVVILILTLLLMIVNMLVVCFLRF